MARHWPRSGTSICCLLFMLIFTTLSFGTTHPHLMDSSVGSAEISLLLFMIPGLVASHFSHRSRVVDPLLGALYALPGCLLITLYWLAEPRGFWQGLAYLFCAFFWCAFGTLCYLYFLYWRERQQKKPGA